MKRMLSHMSAPACGLFAGAAAYGSLDLLALSGVALKQYPRLFLLLILCVSLFGMAAIALAGVTLRLWRWGECKRRLLILYAVEASILFVPGMFTCERMVELIQDVF